MVIKKAKQQTIKRVPVTTRIFSGLRKRVKQVVANTTDTDTKLNVGDIVNAGIITVIDKEPQEILHIVKTYQGGN